jgi:hypothetical protein
MMDETRTICGLNGQNSDSVRNESVINPLNITAYGQLISSTSSLGRYSVHKNDGVSFSKLILDGIIRFGLLKFFVYYKSSF